MSSSKKIYLLRYFAAGVHLSEAPSSYMYSICLGWSGNFVGSESGPIQSVKLLQNMVSNRAERPPSPQPHTVCIYCTLTQGMGGGG